MRLVVGFCGLIAFCASPALAQNAPAANGFEVRVSPNVSLSQPIAAGADTPDKQTAARKTVYELAGQECKLLLDTIARECRLESLNVNSSVQSQNFRGDPSTVFLNTNSTAVFRIVVKQ